MADLLSALKKAGLVSQANALAVEKEKREAEVQQEKRTVDSVVNRGRPAEASSHGKESA